jgi:hypothetical protein
VAFLTGTFFPLVLGESINSVTTRRAIAAEAQNRVYLKSLAITRRSIRAVRWANAEDAANLAPYLREFPKSRMIRALARHYMSDYIKLNKALYHAPLPKPSLTVATINTIGLLSGAALADNEYLGLFTLPELIPNP